MIRLIKAVVGISSRLNMYAVYSPLTQLTKSISCKVQNMYLQTACTGLLNQYTSRRTKYRLKYQRIFLLSGILSFLGLSQNEEKEMTDEEKVIHTMKLGILSIQKGELKKAEDILHVALRMARDTMNENAVTYIYDLLANLALEKGDLNKAENLFKETMKRLLARDEPKNSNAVVEMSLKLAKIYHLKGEMDRAENGFQFCVHTQYQKLISAGENESISDDSILLYGMCLDTYAKFFVTQGKLKIAQHYLLKALDVSQTINGDDSPTTLQLVNDVGTLYTMLEMFDLGEDYLQAALRLGTLTKTEDLPSFYCNLGALYLHSKNISAAKKVCSTALELAKRLGNEEAQKEAQNCLNEVG